MPAAAANNRHDVEGADGPLLACDMSNGPSTLSDITKSFGWMGWAAFGGPAAHVGLFQKVPWFGRMGAPTADSREHPRLASFSAAQEGIPRPWSRLAAM